MEDKKLQNAFPEPYLNDTHLGLSCSKGMSKRFYAACAAVQGILANPNTAAQIQNAYGGIAPKDIADKLVCKQAFTIADELLKQENEL